nr:MAG TPA: hypothetical protein [Bacteriophage sp.]
MEREDCSKNIQKNFFKIMQYYKDKCHKQINAILMQQLK